MSSVDSANKHLAMSPNDNELLVDRDLSLDQGELAATPTPTVRRPGEFARSQASSIPHISSFESLQTLSSHHAPFPILRKRRSNYHTSRGTERSTSPIPELPPNRPPRHPSRSSTFDTNTNSTIRIKPSKTRPSTANSARDVFPMEEKTRTNSATPSVKSKTSSLGLGISTGPVEEVTPWELCPAPEKVPSPSLPASNNVVAYMPSAPSPRTLHPTKPTGLTEDVTPWELEEQTSPSFNAMSISSHPTSIHGPRSKPPSIISNPPASSFRVATGPTEEVTPWELQSLPTAEESASQISQTSSPPSSRIHSPPQRPSLTTAQLEEVTPWELHPAPPPPVINGGGPPALKNAFYYTRPSTASSSKADFAITRRRRSTGNRKGRSNSHPNPPKPFLRSGSSQPISSAHSQDSSSRDPRAPSITSRIPSISSSHHKESGPASSSGSSVKGKQAAQENSKFSTADRTILEELRRNVTARAAQFVLKGSGVHLTDGSVTPGKRHHCYPKKEAPYPRSYDREVLDFPDRDVWETLNCQEICESLTWHVFEEPPGKVLDIGCGTGTWILNCAHTWKNTKFVGLDIVPLQPDLHQVGSADYASRITWVQANFLEGLPFQNEEFDFVHIKRIALGVPEDKWDALFDEISRVLKPGGAFEMIEEDLFFPGKSIDDDDDDAKQVSSLSRSNSSVSANGLRESHLIQEEAVAFTSGDADLVTPRFNSTPVPPIPSSSGSPELPHHTSDSDHGLFRRRRSLSNVASSSQPSLTVPSGTQSHDHTPSPSPVDNLPHHNTTPPKSKSKPRPFLLRTPAKIPANPREHSLLQYIYDETLSSRFINMSPLSLLNTYLDYHFKDTRTHPPILYTFPPVRVKPQIDMDASTDEDDDEDGYQPRKPGVSPTQSTSSRKSLSSTPHSMLDENDISEENRWLSMHGLLHQKSAYVSLDASRTYAFSPSPKSVFHMEKAKATPGARRVSRLPNKTLNFDLGSLNLHLTLRAKEILACSESMWEWVKDVQEAHHNSPVKNRYTRGPSFDSTSSSSKPVDPAEQHKQAVLELTRDDFNQLLLNFEMDMQDHASLGSALEERFQWSVIAAPPSHTRKIFNTACEKYEKYLRKQIRSRRNSTKSGTTTHVTSTISITAPTPERPFTAHGSTQQTHHVSRKRSNSHTISLNGNGNLVERPNGLLAVKPDPSVHFALPTDNYPFGLPPTRRLSRAMCVFVAWKPEKGDDEAGKVLKS